MAVRSADHLFRQSSIEFDIIPILEINAKVRRSSVLATFMEFALPFHLQVCLLLLSNGVHC